ncbi:hypothetical protein GQ600_973 [Phytophthora cactorum]|nr:hypothetical protein GQ600_973 [Phytophthora cactorum]
MSPPSIDQQSIASARTAEAAALATSHSLYRGSPALLVTQVLRNPTCVDSDEGCARSHSA